MAEDGEDSAAPEATKSLSKKMAEWEATEEEQRSSTLGGNIPLVGMPGKPGRVTRTDQPTKIDGFDSFLSISGIILFPLALLLLSFPLCIGSLDLSDVGPPPMT